MGQNFKENYREQLTDDGTVMDDTTFEKFLVWIDGVGGYLVCSAAEHQLGQAIADTDVSIPLRGDIDRKHATIQSVDGNHVLKPLGQVHLDQRRIEQPVVLKSGQIFRMGELVAMKYRKPHPFSGTAVLEFESRHRTFPWSDAVLLAGDTIVMGPEQRNHIVCPKWTEEVVLFRRLGRWYCKSKTQICIDGTANASGTELLGNSHIESQEFSFSIEAL